jgi:hypothetical protein
MKIGRFFAGQAHTATGPKISQKPTGWPGCFPVVFTLYSEAFLWYSSA